MRTNIIIYCISYYVILWKKHIHVFKQVDKKLTSELFKNTLLYKKRKTFKLSVYFIISYNIRTQYKYIQAYEANHPLVLTFDNGQASWPATAVSTAHPPVPRSWTMDSKGCRRTGKIIKQIISLLEWWFMYSYLSHPLAIPIINDLFIPSWGNIPILNDIR